jgi:O-antigen/teichoic acid export membrane protein
LETKPATTSGARRVFGNTILLSFGQGIGLVSMAVWTVAVARYIGPDLYGFYAFAQAVVSVLVIFVGMGLDEITTRDVSQHPGRGRPYLVTFSVAKAIVAAVVLGGFVLISLREATSNEVVVVLVVSVMGAIQSMNSLITSLLYARDRMPVSVIGQSANYVTTMTTGIVAIWLDKGFGTILFLSMVASLIQLAITLAGARRALPRERTADETIRGWTGLRPILRRALPFAAVSIVSVLNSNLLIILLRTVSYSDKALGQFAAAQRLAMIMAIVPSMMVQVLIPSFSRAYAEDRERFAGMFERAYRYVVFASLPAAVALAVVAPALLTLVFGEQFAPAGETLRVLSLVLAGAGVYVLGPALIAMDGQGLLARLHLVNLVAVGVAAYLLIPQFGAEGAAWAMVLGSVGSLAVYSRVLFGRLQLGFPTGWVAKTLVASAVTTAACAALYGRVHFVIVLFLVAPVVYLASHLVLRTLTPGDWQYVRSVLAPVRSAGS